MVIDRNSRPVCTRYELSDNNRVTWRGNRFSIGAQRAKVLHGSFGPAVNIRCVFGLSADCRNFTHSWSFASNSVCADSM